MKMSSLRVMYTFILPLSRSESANGELFAIPRLFRRFVFPHRTGVFATVARVKHKTIGRSRPALPGCGPLCAGGTAFRGRLCCNPPAAPAAGPAILCIGRIEVHHQTLFKPGDRARANSCGFTFCFNSKTIRTVAGQIARRAPT